ncbi:hypothetical protein Vretimale_5882 [Volvox reticuliferus]|nr:hypothetical protein Vretimale_5882 [Volvox reticuliferus]
MIGLPIMDATFGPPGRRLALLTGIPVMLWVVPFAIFAFEMHKVRENAQEQRRRRSGSGSGSSRMPCGAKLENNGGGGGGSISTHADGPDGVTLRKAFSVALPVGTVSRTGGSGTAAAALTMPRSVRHGASAAVLRRRNTGARGADTGVFLTPSRRSGDGSINHIGSGDSSTTTNAVDTRWRSDQNQSTFVDSRPSEAISARGAAKPRRSMDATSDDGGNTGQCPRGIPGPSPGGGAPGGSAGGERIGSTGRTASTGYDEWEMGSGGKSTGAPADLARPGPMLVDAAKAAAGAVKAVTASAALPLPPLTPPRISPFAMMAGGDTGSSLAAGGGGNDVYDVITTRPTVATASPEQATPRRSSSLSAYRAAAAPQLLSTVPSGDLEEVMPGSATPSWRSKPKPASPEASTVLPAVPLPATLSFVSLRSGALYSSERGQADGSTGQAGKAAESPITRLCTAPQPRNSFSGFAGAVTGSAARVVSSAPPSPAASSRLATRPSSATLSAVDLPIPHRWLLGEEEEALPAAGRQRQGAPGGSGDDDTGGVTAEPAAPVVSDTENIALRQLRAVIWTVGKNPLLWSLLLALITNLSGLRKFLDPDSPSFVQELEFIPGFLHWFASIAIPVSLVSIGVWMYGKRMRASLLKQAGTLLLLKVMVLPLLQAACAAAIGLPPGPTMTLVLLALCPTATTSFVIAAHSGYGTDVVSAVTVGGTILLVPAVLVALQLPRGMGITLRLASTPVPSAAGGE